VTTIAAGIGFFIAEATYDWQGLVLVAAAMGLLVIFL